MAIRTISNSGGNYNSVGTWVEGVVPTSADDVVATATSGQLTVNVSSACKSIDFTNYTNTLTMTNSLTVGGNVTLVSGMTITGSGTLSINATSTLTSNGKVWTGALTFIGASLTYTLADNFTSLGIVSFSATGTPLLNGNTLYCSSSISSTSAGTYIAGTTKIVMNGTGAIAGSNGGYAIDIEINTSGTITFTNTIYIKSGTWLHTSGTVNAGTSTINHIAAGAFILSLGSTNLYNVILSSTSVLGTTLNVSNSLTLVGTTLNTYDVNCSGSLAVTGASGGTSIITLNGTGTWTSTSTLSNRLVFNTTGTITVSGICYFGGASITYISGTMITFGSTIILGATCNWDTSGMRWWNVSCIIGQNFTSDLIVDGTFSSSNGNTYNGSNLILNGSLNILQLTIGTTVFRYRGSGNWLGGGWIGNEMYIETDGILYIAGGTFGASLQTARLYYVKGRIDTRSNLRVNNTAYIYGFGNGKVNLGTFTILSNSTAALDNCFWGTPSVKTKIESTATSILLFTSPKQRKAFFVSLLNVRVAQGSLNVVNRDGNRGGNQGVIFGESGINGFPLNQYPIEQNYTFSYGFNNNMIQ